MRRHPFSLMEIMIVCVLVSIVAGISIFSIVPLYRTFRFQMEVSSIYDLMQELQLEALTLQSDMTLSFTQSKGKWSAQSHSEETILKPQFIQLAHTSQINFCFSQDKPLTITFYSNGLIEPREILLLSSPTEKRWLDFSHPILIKLWKKEPPKFEELIFPRLDQLKSKKVREP